MSEKRRLIEKPYLRLDTVLGEDRYRVDGFLDDNDLVVSYAGYDIFRQKKVVIRELFPKAILDREPGEEQGVLCRQMASETTFDSMKQHMIARAKRLIGLYPIDYVANILTYFEENGTVYVIEEDQPETETFARTLFARHSAKFTVEDLLKYLKPLFATLSRLHKRGIWHGSINPDTILITKDKQPVLTHFADPCEDMAAEILGSPAIRQEGFCPVELYVPEATPGPKADIFEMGALLYRYVTGETVMPYYERINEEKVPTEPKDMKTRVMDFQSDAIMKAVELYDFDRFSTLDELLAELAPADMDLDSLHDQQEEARNFKKAPLKYRREQQFKWGYIIAIAAMAVFLVIFLIPRVVVVSDTVKIDRFYKKFHQASEYEKCLMLSKLTKEQRDNYTNNYRDLPGDVTEEEQSKLLSVRYYDYILKHYVPISQVDRKRPGYEYVKIDLRSNTAVVTYIAAEGDVEEEYKLRPFIDGSYQVIRSYTDDSGKKQSDTLIVNEKSPK